jgi:hypothetical protein
MKNISNVAELKLEIIRRKTLANHQKVVINKDWQNLKTYAGKYNYAGRFFRYLKGGDNSQISFIGSFFKRFILKAEASNFYQKIPSFLRPFINAFAKAKIDDLKEKIKNTWQQYIGFFTRG